MPAWVEAGVDAHPDTETLAAFAEGTLPVSEHEAVERHVADCEDCYEVVAEILKGEAQAEGVTVDQAAAPDAGRVVPMKSSRRWSRGAVIGGASALAAAAAVLVMVWVQPRNAAGPHLDKLVAAVGTERTVEARLTGGFAHAPLRSPSRSRRSTDNLALLAVAGELQQSSAAAPTASAVHAFGVAQLLLHRYDEAIASLQDAAARERSAPVLSDLSAAYLARSQATGRSADAAVAHEHALQALELDPQLREALFNRALAIEALGLAQQALAAWEAYVAAESDSAWRTEAERHLQRLRGSVANLSVDRIADDRDAIEALIARDASPLRDGIERDILSKWVEAMRSGNRADATAHQRAGADLATVLVSKLDDHFGRDLIASLEVAGAAAAVDAVATYLEARSAFDESRLTESGRLFRRAADELQRADNPLHHWAELYWAATEYYAGRVEPALAHVRGIRWSSPPCAIPLSRAALRRWRADPARAG